MVATPPHPPTTYNQRKYKGPVIEYCLQGLFLNLPSRTIQATMKKKINVTIQLTEDDYINYIEYFFKVSKEGSRRTRRLYMLGFGAFLLYAGIMRNHELYGIQNPNTYAAHIALVFCLFAGLFWLFISIVRPSIARLSLKTGSAKTLLLPVTYSFDDEAIEIRNKDGKGRIHLAAIRGYEEHHDYIYIHLGGMSAFVLPKAQLDSPTQQNILECLEKTTT